MLGAEVAFGPSGTRLELDAQKVPDLTKNTVFDYAQELPVGIADAEDGVQGHGTVHLQAGARKRDVF